jgi:hypothetical protein
MALINTGSFTKALWPGVNAWYGKVYDEFKPEYTDLFDKYTSRRAFEEDVGVTGFGLASVKGEGAPITYDTMGQGFTTRYQHVVYAMGFVITEEMVDDDLYDVVGKARAESLAFSMRATKETVGANVYNRAFTAAYSFGDGKEMCATDHPNVTGGTWANELATPAALSEASLEQACVDLMKFTNDRGLKINIQPQSLIIPVDLVFDVERILKSDLRVSTANNDINALKLMGKFPNGVKVNHYLTSTTAWFIRTNATNGLKYFERKGDSFGADNDFDTSNAKFKASGRYSFGVTDPRSIFGTPGA